MAARNDAEYVAFVEAVQDRLRRTAYLMTGDWTLAADITQDALIKVYVAWPRLERSDGMAAYARTAVVSASIDHHRKRAGRPEILVDSHDEAKLSSADGSGEERTAPWSWRRSARCRTDSVPASSCATSRTSASPRPPKP